MPQCVANRFSSGGAQTHAAVCSKQILQTSELGHSWISLYYCTLGNLHVTIFNLLEKFMNFDHVT